LNLGWLPNPGGNQQRFKVQLVQCPIGQNHDRCITPDEFSGWSYKQLVKRLAILIAGFLRILRVQESLAVALDTGDQLIREGSSTSSVLAGVIVHR